jgi:antitoxin (DNA-binding transcriptional repressor) of toxin-antitoxin stability system
MEKIIGLKELRENTEQYVRDVGQGATYVVMRKSKPLFRIAPLEEAWEIVIDFTKLRKGGVKIEELLSRL